MKTVTDNGGELSKLIDSGYFAKRVLPRPDWISASHVREICSVSNCISQPPEDWLNPWLHNELGWFNSIDDALRVIPKDALGQYRLFAYRLSPRLHRQGARATITVPADVHPEPVPADFISRGFDAVSRSMETVLGLECSPLSCNNLAAERDVNEFCLFPSLDAALAGADAFSLEQPEPGDYYVVQVLESPRRLGSG